MAETQTDAQTTTQTAAQTATQETTQQVTSIVPATKVKNRNRVNAGKAIAVKRRQALEEQNKKIAEADAIIANDRLRKAQEEVRKAEEVVAPPFEALAAPPAAAPVAESQTLTTTQWLSVASIIVSLVAIYYKRRR